jgi:hypothetical protein
MKSSRKAAKSHALRTSSINRGCGCGGAGAGSIDGRAVAGAGVELAERGGGSFLGAGGRRKEITADAVEIK